MSVNWILLNWLCKKFIRSLNHYVVVIVFGEVIGFAYEIMASGQIICILYCVLLNDIPLQRSVHLLDNLLLGLVGLAQTRLICFCDEANVMWLGQLMLGAADWPWRGHVTWACVHGCSYCGRWWGGRFGAICLMHSSVTWHMISLVLFW